MPPVCDVLVIGSGFGGVLSALILQRHGLRVVVVDRARHPRFLIGESSTPMADLVWHDLCQAHQLDRLAPLAEYGSWQSTYPQLPCGLKRGFSYFAHSPHSPTSGGQPPARFPQLLVSASQHDADADTHWYRPEFDLFLVQEARAAGVEICEEAHGHLAQAGSRWHWSGQVAGITHEWLADFVLDASGEANVLGQVLDLGSLPLQTHSRSVFGHFHGVRPWGELLDEWGHSQAPHPFPCDDAALHHVIDGGWMYVLRFNNGITSAGFLLDTRQHPDRGDSPDEEWRRLLAQYPAIARQFAQASTTPLCGGLRKTRRLQRRRDRVVGSNWALLPFTAYGLDALHSTGNAHTLRGVERLCQLLLDTAPGPDRQQALDVYQRLLQQEIDLLDQIVAGCYASFRQFDLFASFSMIYFAAAVFSEDQRRRGNSGIFDAHLLAGNDAYRRVVNAGLDALQRQLARSRPADTAELEAFRAEIARLIAPFNLAGFCDPARQHMYPYI